MDERDILKKIADSAKDIEIPDVLDPEHMKRQLKRRRYRKIRFYQWAAAAACLCLCFGAGSYAYRNTTQHQTAEQPLKTIESSRTDLDKAEPESHAQPAAESIQEPAPLKKIGRMYRLAEDYEEVYDVLEKAAEKSRQEKQLEKAEHEDSMIRNDMADEDAVYSDMTAGSAKTESIRQKENSASSDPADYSGTNLQVEGIDESDIVKTDGRYIYTAAQDCVQIVDVRSQVPKAAGTLRPQINEDTDRIREMYLSDGGLVLIVQTEKTAVKPEEDPLNADDGMAEDDSGGLSDEIDDSAAKKAACVAEDVYRMDIEAVTKVLNYDMTDPQNPVLLASSAQDGWYQDSRKAGNCLYLFTNKQLLAEDGMARAASAEDMVKDWIPKVNQIAVSADCIYMQEGGTQGLTACSMDLSDHNRVLDTKLLISRQAQIYVTHNSMYLYYGEYTNQAVKTRIARFALEEGGKMRAVAAAALKGSIEDTFAFSENDGYLRVLTSVTSADPWENRVYVLDENMQTAGKLIGLAEGEKIYSARFAGSTGYFVTYRNTDPLFTVDFSNPEEPKVMGELKVTGFSDYLHFWSEDKLLGIGRETNPDTGEEIGLKLCMFDISDPADVKEAGKAVLKGADSEALYNYKSILVSREKNIIAFPVQSWKDGFRLSYHVFSYDDGKFTDRLVRGLAADDYKSENSWRGLYIRDIFYLAGEKKVIAFDMKNGWKEIGKVKYKK